MLIDRYTRDGASKYETSLYTPPELYLCRRELSERTELMYRTTEALLLRLAQYAEERDAPMVFVVAPSLVQVDEDLWFSTLADYGENPADYSRSLPNSRLMRFAEENDLLMLDLLPILESELKQGRQSYNPEQEHWNSQGNRIVAGALLQYLESRGMVGSPFD